jgi:hypothetical protein
MLPTEQYQFQGNNGGPIFTEEPVKRKSFFVWILRKLHIAKTDDQAEQMIVVILLLVVSATVVFLVLNVQPAEPKFITKTGKVLNLDQVIQLKKQQGREL